MLDQPITSKMLAEKDGAVGRLIFNNPARHNAVSLEFAVDTPLRQRAQGGRETSGEDDGRR